MNKSIHIEGVLSIKRKCPNLHRLQQNLLNIRVKMPFNVLLTVPPLFVVHHDFPGPRVGNILFCELGDEEGRGDVPITKHVLEEQHL